VDERILNYAHVETIKSSPKKVAEESFPYGIKGKKESKKKKAMLTRG